MATSKRTSPRRGATSARPTPGTRKAQTPSDPLYIPLEQAAALAGVSRSFMEREIAEGRLPAIRDVGLKVHRDDLAQWRGQPVAAAPAVKKAAARAGSAASAA
jgi:excisionase family DNA binding protein